MTPQILTTLILTLLASTPHAQCEPHINTTYYTIQHEYHPTQYNCNDYSWDLVEKIRNDGNQAYTVLGRINKSFYTDTSKNGLHRAVCVMVEPQTGNPIPKEAFNAITLGMTKGEREYRG